MDASRAALAAPGATLSSSCSKTPTGAAEKATASEVAQPTPRASARPRTKQHAPTPATKLGTPPGGVGLPRGRKAPDVTIRDAAGREVRLGELHRNGPLLLVSHRGGWCPGQQILSSLDSAGIGEG